ncbi:hypothetical protein JW998_08865 [candidate division KSB1 bacterium]|nr:hypothetical protein [candidate division KSB1 bacterium]
MAKVENPLFADFIEAFADVIVFQRNGSSSVIARQKVRHPTNPRSAHYPNRIAGWARAIDQHQRDGAPDEELLNYVSHYALSPDRPTNVRTLALAIDHENPDQQQFTIAWDAPTTKYNGHPLDNLYGYFIEITYDFASWQRLNAAPHHQTEYSDSIPNGDVYVLILAVDTLGNVSSHSEAVRIELSAEAPYFDACHFDRVYFVGPGPSKEEPYFGACHFNIVIFV